MASLFVRSTKLLLLRRLSRALKSSSSSSSCSFLDRSLVSSFSVCHFRQASRISYIPYVSTPPRTFYYRSSHLQDASEGPAVVDYISLLQEDKYHKLADTTINYLLEKLEEYGDSVDIGDDFDIDYGNEVLTLKLGTLGTYVLNKQTPNRQIWLSSPISGPSRFDWDPNTEGWIYRRTKANLYEVLENELKQLCGVPISLS